MRWRVFHVANFSRTADMLGGDMLPDLVVLCGRECCLEKETIRVVREDILRSVEKLAGY